MHFRIINENASIPLQLKSRLLIKETGIWSRRTLLMITQKTWIILSIFQQDKFSITHSNGIVASLVPFWNSQTSVPSSNKYTTFHRITPIPDCTIAFVSPEKDKDNTLEKISSSKVDAYIDSAYD